MSDPTPTPPGPPETKDVVVPCPTKDKQFWLKRIDRQFRTSLASGIIGILFMFAGVLLTLAGLDFAAAAWTATVGGILKLQNAGPGTISLFLGLFIIWSTRFNQAVQGIGIGRAQMLIKINAASAEQRAIPTPNPNDDVDFWDHVITRADTLSQIFRVVAFVFMIGGVILSVFGFSYTLSNFTAEIAGDFGLAINNAGPGPTMAIVGAALLYLTRFDISAKDIGNTHALADRIKEGGDLPPAPKKASS